MVAECFANDRLPVSAFRRYRVKCILVGSSIEPEAKHPRGDIHAHNFVGLGMPHFPAQPECAFKRTASLKVFREALGKVMYQSSELRWWYLLVLLVVPAKIHHQLLRFSGDRLAVMHRECDAIDRRCGEVFAAPLSR
jgi:hypothetical protein